MYRNHWQFGPKDDSTRIYHNFTSSLDFHKQILELWLMNYIKSTHNIKMMEQTRIRFLRTTGTTLNFTIITLKHREIFPPSWKISSFFVGIILGLSRHSLLHGENHTYWKFHRAMFDNFCCSMNWLPIKIFIKILIIILIHISHHLLIWNIVKSLFHKLL